MKITKRQLRRIIRENCGETLPAESQSIDYGYSPEDLDLGIEAESDAPCPFSTADKLSNSGMTQQEIVQWIETLAIEALASEPVGYVEDPAQNSLPAPTLELVP